MTSKQDIEAARKVRIADLLGIKNPRHRNHTRCPFHQDKSPSLVIYPDNSFHCYGCGAHGNNAIDFVIALFPGKDPKEAFKEAVYELNNYRYPQ